MRRDDDAATRRRKMLHDRLCRAYSGYKEAHAKRPGDSVEYISRLVQVIDCVENLTAHLQGVAWLEDD